MPKTINIFIVSDATGATAETVATSVLVQFTGAKTHIRRFPFIRTVEDVRAVVDEAPAGECIIVFTFVTPELSQAMVSLGEAKDLTVVDLISPLMSTVSSVLKYSPAQTPGLLRSADEDLDRATKAIHYTLQHDDGQGLETLDNADLIILGVSRTGKTPASIYLSCRKLKVANIPIVNGVPLPEKVYSLPVRKVGFRIQLERLVKLRSERVRHMSYGAIPGYADEKSVFEELEYAAHIYKRIQRLRTIDVTERSIEETSDWITHHVL